MWRSSLWSISWLRHQMFYPYVTISAAQAQESDYLRYAMSPFSLFLSSFSGTQRILGYVRPRRIVAVRSPKTRKRRSTWRRVQMGTDFMQRCDVFGLQMLLWRMQTQEMSPYVQLSWNDIFELLSISPSRNLFALSVLSTIIWASVSRHRSVSSVSTMSRVGSFYF